MKKKSKVMHIVTTMELGGAQKNTLFTVTLLDQNKYDVFLVAGKEGILHREGNNLKNVKIFYLNSLLRQISPLRDIVSLVRLYRLIRHHQIDIVHTHSTKAGILGRIAAKLASVPVIIHTAHGWSFHDFQNPLIKKIYISLERICARFSSSIIAVSEETIRRGLKEKISEKENYVKIFSAIEGKKFRETQFDRAKKRRELGLNETDFVILNIACFKPQKNHSDFIEAARKVIQSVPQAKFVLVGDGTLREKIVATIKFYKLEKYFLLLKWREDIPELMKMADLIGMTSLFEGLPQVCLQALAAGKPMVMYGADGIKEIIENGKNGFVLEPKDKDGFAQKLIELGTHPLKLQDMEFESFNKWKAEYDVTDMITKIDSLYQHHLLTPTLHSSVEVSELEDSVI